MGGERTNERKTDRMVEEREREPFSAKLILPWVFEAPSPKTRSVEV